MAMLTTHLTHELSRVTPAGVSESKAAEAQPWLPETLLTQYAERAAAHARLEELEDGTWFADIVGFEGLWASGETPEEALAEMRDVVFGWVLVKVRHGDADIPTIEGIDLSWR